MKQKQKGREEGAIIGRGSQLQMPPIKCSLTIREREGKEEGSK